MTMAPLNELSNSWVNALAAITALLGAVAAFYKARHEYALYVTEHKKSTTTTTPSGADDIPKLRPLRSIRILVAATAVSGTLLGIGLTILVLRHGVARFDDPEGVPLVDIEEPSDRSGVAAITEPNGSSHFDVRGKSRAVVNKSSKRVYLLVHPAQPVAPGWWIQPEVAMDSEGKWSGVAWVGAKDFETTAGSEVWIMAIVGRREPLPKGADGQPWIESPEILDPISSSRVKRVQIASVKKVAGP
jgi:hypothetical protein